MTLDQFRFALIEFLRLPFNIDETALREELERASPNLLRNYLARVERETIEAEDTATWNVLGGGDLAITK